jgi:hypothetical protein
VSARYPTLMSNIRKRNGKITIPDRSLQEIDPLSTARFIFDGFNEAAENNFIFGGDFFLLLKLH